jgi:hypothetical protein
MDPFLIFIMELISVFAWRDGAVPFLCSVEGMRMN